MFIRSLMVILFMSIPFIMINFSALLKGGQPSATQIVVSVAYCAGWLLFGLVSGYKGVVKFVVFATLYWGSGAVGLIVAYYAGIIVFIPFALLFAGPIYGLKYFVGGPSELPLIYVNIAVVFGTGILGFLLGYTLRMFVKRRDLAVSRKT